MTSDYVSWVLGLQGWERCACIDAYMAGEEYDLECPGSECDEETKCLVVKVSSFGTQTPSEWWGLESLSTPKGAAPAAPPSRLVLLRPGTARANPL